MVQYISDAGAIFHPCKWPDLRGTNVFLHHLAHCCIFIVYRVRVAPNILKQ